MGEGAHSRTPLESLDYPAARWRCMSRLSNYGGMNSFGSQLAFGNITFPSSRNKGKLISPHFTKDKFVRSLPVAERFLPLEDSQSILRLFQISLIELIFDGVQDKYAIFFGCTLIAGLKCKCIIKKSFSKKYRFYKSCLTSKFLSL